MDIPKGSDGSLDVNSITPSKTLKPPARGLRNSVQPVTTMTPRDRGHPSYNELRSGDGIQDLRHEEDISGFHRNAILYDGSRNTVKVTEEPLVVPKSSSSSTTTTTSTTEKPLGERNVAQQWPNEPRMVYSGMEEWVGGDGGGSL